MANTRVTQSMLNTQLLRNLNQNTIRMSTLQDQASTGRRINKPSDDPVGLSFAMRYRSDLSANDQYEENVDSANSWLEYTDTTLEQTGNVFQRIRQLAVQASNGPNPQSALDAIEKEVRQLSEQLISVGNSQFNGKYIFNGQKTDIRPYTEGVAEDPLTMKTVIQASTESTDAENVLIEIGAGMRIPISITGEEIFGKANDENNAFKILSDLIDTLKSGDHEGVSTMLERIDNRLNTILEARAEIGAKMNRIELAGERLRDIGVNLQTLQTNIEDVDMAELITNLKTSENVYQASLSIGAKIIRPSLIDFLN